MSDIQFSCTGAERPNDLGEIGAYYLQKNNKTSDWVLKKAWFPNFLVAAFVNISNFFNKNSCISPNNLESLMKVSLNLGNHKFSPYKIISELNNI